MNKNPNKKAGNWGALKNKPQNLVPFKSGGKVKVTAGGEKHVIYKKTTKRGEGKVGNIMVNHPTKDKGVWDTIDLTKKSGATTVKQGVASTKKWHKENPYNDMKKQLTNKKQAGGTITQMRRKNLTNKYNKQSDKLIAYKNKPLDPILKSEDYYSNDPAKVNTYKAAEKVQDKADKKFLNTARKQAKVTGKMEKIDLRNTKQMGGPSQKSKTVTKNGSYRTVEKMKGTPSSMKESSKTTRTGYGILKGAPKYKNIIQAPSPSAKPINPSAGGMMKKGGAIKKKK